VRTSSTNHYHF